MSSLGNYWIKAVYLMQQTIMPDSATKIIEKGMTLKPPIGRFLKTYSGKAFRQHPALLFSSGHPDGYWYLQSWQRKNNVFYHESSCHVNDNHWGFDYLSVLNLCGYCKSFCIPQYLLVPEYKDVYPNQVWYKGNARRKKRSRGLRRYTFPLFHRRPDNATCSHGVLGCSPSKPCEIRWHIKVCHPSQCSDALGCFPACPGWN